MYGNFWTYLNGWASFALVNFTGTAGISFISAQYLEYFITFPRFSPEIEPTFNQYSNELCSQAFSYGAGDSPLLLF